MIYLGNSPVGVASYSKRATGTFTGDGTATATLNIGFKPETVLVKSDQDYSQTGWAGVGHATLGRYVGSCIWRHNNSSASTAGSTAFFFGNYEYGNPETTASYVMYAVYSEGVLTLKNSSPGNGTKFLSGVTYTWEAYA
jgi:hypothetical protein